MKAEQYLFRLKSENLLYNSRLIPSVPVVQFTVQMAKLNRLVKT